MIVFTKHIAVSQYVFKLVFTAHSKLGCRIVNNELIKASPHICDLIEALKAIRRDRVAEIDVKPRTKSDPQVRGLDAFEDWYAAYLTGLKCKKDATNGRDAREAPVPFYRPIPRGER